VKRHVLPALLAASLVLGPTADALAAAAPPAAASPAPAPSEASHAWRPSPEVLAQGAGALIGLGVFSLFVAPEALGGVAGLLGGRLMGATAAGMGAVAGTFAYDVWTGQPLQYAYFWYRGGFIAGLAGGIAAFGVLGYPGGGGTTWLGWTANRAALIGTGMIGAWAADHWYHNQ